MSSEKQGKKKQIVFRCTEEEYTRIAKAAKRVRRTPSDFMRIALDDACNYIFSREPKYMQETKFGKQQLSLPKNDREWTIRDAFYGTPELDIDLDSI